LEDAGKQAAKAGDLEEVKRIAEAAEEQRDTRFIARSGEGTWTMKHYRFKLKPNGVLETSWWPSPGRWIEHPDGSITATIGEAAWPDWILVPHQKGAFILIRSRGELLNCELWRLENRSNN
jgi:hypothetical protein